MSAASNAVPQCLQGTPGARGFDGIRPKCRGDSIFQLLQRTSEDLAARLELGSESEEAEAVVAGDVESRGELIEKHVKLPPRIAREAAEPRVEGPGRAVIHGRTTLTRGRLRRRVANVPCAHLAGSRAAPPRNPW